MAAYKAACVAAGCRDLACVTEAYAAAANSNELELNCAGNRVVELLDDRMVDLDMAPLAVALQEFCPFQRINFSYNKLGAGAAHSLNNLVANNNIVSALDLSENDFSEKAAQALCAGLKQNRSISDLRLSGNKLGGPGGMALADLLQTNSTLTRVDAANCELDTAALVALATVLRDNTSLMVLDVSRPLAKTLMEEPAVHFARMLKVNTSLIELNLNKAMMSDFGLRLICEELYRAGPSTQLQTLAVCGNRIQLVDADCVRALHMLLTSPSCRLTKLLLGNNNLRDEGALKLAEVVGDALAAMPTPRIRHLDVKACGITSRGLCALARAVAFDGSSSEMEEMELWGNRFDSAACLAWIPSLQYMKLDIAVQEVDRGYNVVRC